MEAPSGRRERPHPTWIRSSSFQEFGMAAPNPPGLSPIFSNPFWKCRSCAGSGDALGMPKVGSCHRNRVREHLGMWNLGIFGKDGWLSLGNNIPRGAGWSGDGEETQGGLRLWPGFVHSGFGIGICLEWFQDWDSSGMVLGLGFVWNGFRIGICLERFWDWDLSGVVLGLGFIHELCPRAGTIHRNPGNLQARGCRN